MIYLAGAIFFYVVLTFVMKYSESRNSNRFGVTAVNYAVGSISGYMLMKDKTLIITDSDGIFTISFAVLHAFLFVARLVLMQYSIKRNGAPLSATFGRIGIIIPITISALIFGEMPTITQIIGIFIVILAIIYMGKDDKKESKAQSASIGIMILLFLCNGSQELMSKLFNEFGNQTYQERYVFYIFVFSLIISLGICIATKKKITKQDILMGMCIGIPNQLVSLLLVKAVGALPAYIVYPGYSASIIIIVNILNIIIYKEILSKREYIATCIIVLALGLINL